MARYHGVTDETYRRFVIDAGAVYKNYGGDGQTLLGATRGGNTFTVETEYKDMAVDGAKGPVVGSRRITKVTAKLTANFIEFSSTILNMAAPGSSITTTSTHSEINRALSIALTDYCSNIALVGQVSGSAQPAIFTIYNALADSNVELAMTDNEEGVLAMTFTAHFDPDTLDTEPWEIAWPIIADDLSSRSASSSKSGSASASPS